MNEYDNNCDMASRDLIRRRKLSLKIFILLEEINILRIIIKLFWKCYKN